MIKARLKERLVQCFAAGVEKGYWTAAAAGDYGIEVPKNPDHGDFSTNMAMVMAGKERKNPRELAARLVELLGAHTDLVERLEVAGPGFVNIVVPADVWRSVLPLVCQQNESFGRSQIGAGKKVLVEFVSANPTGP
ncbi:MAG: arginine--tRNA ligase, partial [Desulfobulbaceae bacterium]|nr:arginine--tRNA ligase [Desulfobulbaceae bacterium]